MNEPLLLAGILVCCILVSLSPFLLLYGIPVRSVLSFTLRENSVRDTFTVTWGLFGARILHDQKGTQVAVLAGSRVLKTFFPDRITGDGEKKTTVQPEPPYREIARFSGNLIKPLESLGAVIWQESRFAGAKGKFTLGFGDPSLTGLCYGYYWASRFALEALNIHIEIEPVFDREVLAGDIDIRMNLNHPLRVLIALFRLVTNPAVRRGTSLFRHHTPGAAA